MMNDSSPATFVSKPEPSIHAKKPPVVPFTISEGLEALLEKQNEIKAALDHLIADATTLRAQM